MDHGVHAAQRVAERGRIRQVAERDLHPHALGRPAAAARAPGSGPARLPPSGAAEAARPTVPVAPVRRITGQSVTMIAPLAAGAQRLKYPRELVPSMAYVIAEPCIGQKDNSCVEVCPVDCIHPTPDEPDYDKVEMLYIDPEECIDCDACVEACPVDACFAEDQLPDEWTSSPRSTRITSSKAAETCSLRRLGGHRQRGARDGGHRRRPEGAWNTPSSCGVAAMMPRAAWRIACEAGESGSSTTSGRPSSAPTRSSSWSGTLPEQRHVELVGELLPAALSEDREPLAAGRGEARHVLDHAARSRG